MNKTFKFLPLVAATAALAGCQDYDLGLTSEEIQFKKNFEAVYGHVDPYQDWNLVTRAAVTVTPGNSSDIRIYAAVNGSYKIVGHYSDVTSTRTLGIDVVEGTKKLLVTDGCKSYTTEVGGSVNFSGTRSVYPSSGNGSQEAAVSVNGSYTVFSKDFMEVVLKNPGGVLPEEEENINHVVQDFNFVSTGPFTFYPIYWNTTSTHVLGIYWRDELGEIHTQEVYASKKGDELALFDGSTYDSDTPNGRQESAPISTSIASKGITVSLPVGTTFGMYLDVFFSDTYRHTVYSESSVNKKTARVSLNGKQTENSWTGQNYTKLNSPTDGSDYVFGATFETEVEGTGTTYKFFCFEDWDMRGPDLNDLVFVFSKDNTPITIDQTADNWIICAEDLGNTFDIDYNDIVLEVAHLSGETTATITPLAAGGTLASFIYFNDGQGGEDQCIGEIHSLFGVETKKSGQYSPINVDATKPSYSGSVTQKTITVPSTWSLASYGVDDWDDTDSNHSSVMGGFNIKVVPAGETASETNATKSGMKVVPNTTPGEEDVPYIFCVPKIWSRDNGDGTYTMGKYRWPMEEVPMIPTTGFGGYAYNETGHSFDMWVSDKSNKDWYAYPNLATTVSDFDPVTRTASSSSDITIDITDGFEPKAYANLTMTYNNAPLAEGATIEVNAGSTVSVWVASNSSGAYTYSSDNSMIASAATGNYGHECRIDAHSKGTTTVYITQAEWVQDATLTYRETVRSFNVKVVGVRQNPTLTLSSSSISIGSDVASNNDIAVSTNSDGEVSVSSDHEEFVRATIVDNKVVITPVAEGHATLTVNVAKTDDYNSASATLDVTITAPQHKLTCNAESSYTFTTFNATQTFSATSSTGTVSVSSSNSSVATATIQDGVVTITSVANGEANITVSVTGDGYLTNNKVIAVSVENYTVIPLNAFDTSTGKGGLSKDIFGSSTSVKITFVLGTKQNSWDNDSFGLYLYAANETDLSNGYSSNGIFDSNVNWNQANEITITAEQMNKIKEQGFLGYVFKAVLRDQLLKVYFEDL